MSNTGTLTKVKGRGNIASWSIHSNSYGPLCGRSIMGQRLSLLIATFKLSFAQSFWSFNLRGEFYIYHLLLLVSWGSCRPMSPSKLEAGPGSPSWDEKESRRLFTRFTSTSTGVSSSSSVWIVAFDVPWIQINLCQFKESTWQISWKREMESQPQHPFMHKT